MSKQNKNKFKGSAITLKKSSIILKDEIGAGAFSFIYTIKNDPNFICKLINQESDKFFDSYKRELQAFTLIGHHKNLIFCKDSFTKNILKDNQFCGLLLEYCPKGCIFDVLEASQNCDLSEI